MAHDAQKTHASETEAREVAEAAREKEWDRRSFAKALFEGRFNLDLVHPMPEGDGADEERAGPFLEKLEAYAREHIDGDAIDREGHVLGPSSRTPGLPAITGLRDRGLRPGSYLEEQLVRDALSVLDIIDTTRLSQVIRVATIDVRHPEYLDIRLRDGERVLMGRDRLDWRLTRLAQSLQTAAQLGRSIMTIDLTVNKNPPVEWR